DRLTTNPKPPTRVSYGAAGRNPRTESPTHGPETLYADTGSPSPDGACCARVETRQDGSPAIVESCVDRTGLKPGPQPYSLAISIRPRGSLHRKCSRLFSRSKSRSLSR